MPRKPSMVAPATRIRENQRQARVRKRELIDDLKSRVREFERQGIVATAQLQQAARKVMLENDRLRALLAEKGVSVAEIEAFVNRPSHGASSASTTAISKVTAHTQGPHVLDLKQSRNHVNEDLEGETLEPDPSAPALDRGLPDLDEAISSKTVCSVAAKILADFRFHGDVERASAELGCLSDSHKCSITNAALFDALDSEHESNARSTDSHIVATAS